MTHIKLYGIKPRIQYVADGILTTYDFPFVVFTTTDVQVYLNDTLQDPKTYTVSGIKTNGGTIAFTTPPSNGTIITITRDLSIERTTDFQEGGALRADTLNDELDYQTACLQQIADNINRSMILPPYATDTDVDLTLPTPSAGKAIVWNAEGTNLENSSVKINELESTLKGYKESAEHSSIISEESAKSALQQLIEATKQADIASTQAEIATEKATEVSNALSTKANTNMDNITPNGINSIIRMILPDYSATITGVGNNYTAPTEGYYWFAHSTINTETNIYINNICFSRVINAYGANGGYPILLSTGDTIHIGNSLSSTSTLNATYFIPLKGVSND